MSERIGGVWVWDFRFGRSCMGKREDNGSRGGAVGVAAILGVKGVVEGQGAGTPAPAGRTNGLTQGGGSLDKLSQVTM